MRAIPSVSFAFLAVSALGAGCSGSCADDGADFCGGQSDGNCFCDSACVDVDDCCADKSEVCGGPMSTCENAGGECVALTPDACQDGVSGDESCGGALGVMCCLPSAAP